MKESTFVKKRHIKTTIKCVGIIKNNHITGVEYGLIEIPNITEVIVQSPKNKGKKSKERNTKYNSVKNTHTKTENVEKETKSATQKPKRKYRMRVSLVYSYNFKNLKKQPVNLTEKHLKKKKDLFKKKQRKDKIALQNFAQRIVNIEPLFYFMELTKQKNR